ncbi:Meiotic recombination protein dmc1, partial [Conglomerata obtusa]
MLEAEPQIQISYAEEEQFQPIEDLQTQGIALADIIKLKQAGICTAKGVFMVTKKNLIKIKGMSEQKVDKIKEAAAKLLGTCFMTASTYATKREMVSKISTGSTDFDSLLGG